MREALQPTGKGLPRQPLIKRHELASCHPGENKCTSFAISSKQNRKKQVRVPVPPEMPELLGNGGTDIPVCPSLFLPVPGGHPANRASTRHREKQRRTDGNVGPTVAQNSAFLAALVPHLFFLFCFEEMAKLVHLFSPGWQEPSSWRLING